MSVRESITELRALAEDYQPSPVTQQAIKEIPAIFEEMQAAIDEAINEVAKKHRPLLAKKYKGYDGNDFEDAFDDELRSRDPFVVRSSIFPDIEIKLKGKL